MNKFRAYDTFNNKMYYPDVNGYFFDDFSHDEFVIDGLGEPIFLSDMSTPKEMVLMRSVGISDVTGKDIYEGDIMKTDTINKYVDWNQPLCLFGLRINSSSATSSISSEFKIIGNIHENPELL